MMTRRMLATALATAVLLAGAAAPALSHGSQGSGGAMGPGMMGPGFQGPSYGGSGPMGQGVMPCHGMGPMMMGPGMMGPGMMGPGMWGPGMMGPGMMGHGMWGHGMMGPGMMGPGMMGPGPMGPGMRWGQAAGPERDLSADDVRKSLERHLAWLGNPRLQVGAVTETDDNTVAADIVTKDGALVDKLAIDRHTGMMRRSAE